MIQRFGEFRTCHLNGVPAEPEEATPSYLRLMLTNALLTRRGFACQAAGVNALLSSLRDRSSSEGKLDSLLLQIQTSVGAGLRARGQAVGPPAPETQQRFSMEIIFYKIWIYNSWIYLF